tara:strand:+ start:195144 stop:195962 length:819 start_codon:yes stop_codon:yes gene_type:complete
MSEFNNKTVIITGASAGLGAACARAFAEQGANLVLAARGMPALEKIRDELAAKTRVLAVSMDVADDEACAALLENAEQEFGAVHGLINNAGLHQRGEVRSVTPQQIGAMIDVNLRAPLMLSAAVIPYLERAGGGFIVMVGSLAGLTPIQGAATYAGSKAGLRAFAYSMADELRDSGVHVGVVSPGPIDTGFIMDEIDEVEDIVFSQPMSTAEQVAEAVLEVAAGKAVEICLPASGRALATLGYVFPGVRRRLRPRMSAKGRKNKDKYRNRKA